MLFMFVHAQWQLYNLFMRCVLYGMNGMILWDDSKIIFLAESVNTERSQLKVMTKSTTQN